MPPGTVGMWKSLQDRVNGFVWLIHVSCIVGAQFTVEVVT
jgi:hypothetical protein